MEPPPHAGQARAQSTLARLSVLDVRTTAHTKIVRAVHLGSGAQLVCRLADEWADSQVQSGDIVIVIPTAPDGSLFTPASQSSAHATQLISVTHDLNLLVVHPDCVISSTAVADSLYCLRKSVISAKSPALATPSTSALYGSMIHSLFQILLVSACGAFQRFDEWKDSLVLEMHEAAEDVLSEYVEQLYMADVSTNAARRVLHSVFSELDRWFSAMLRPTSAPTSKTGGHSSLGSLKDASDCGVGGVLDVEELVWSSTLGLKGKMDASVRFTSANSSTSTGPLEVKTGNSVGGAAVAHTAQVILYNLLMTERYREPVKFGMVTYLRYDRELQHEDSSAPSLARVAYDFPPSKVQIPRNVCTRMVPVDRNSLVGLMMQRNRLASFLKLGSSYDHLPPLLESGEVVCSMCFAKDTCLVQHKLIERGTAQTVSDGPGEALFEALTAHLQPRDATYYNLWRRILQDEQQLALESKRDMWIMDASRREKFGSCLANLKLASCNIYGDTATRGGRKFRATFRHEKGNLFARDQMALTTGEFVTVSGEVVSVPGDSRDNQLMLAVANGFLESLSENHVRVSVSKDLDSWCKKHNINAHNVIWRLDHDSKISIHATSQENLEQLFCRRELSNLRDLIVGGKAPRFEELGSKEENSTTLSLCKLLNLNPDQNKAMSWARRAQDYLLVLGMPGTGKSTTLAAIILSFVKEGKSVLLCSYTNAAVDNVLIILLQLNFTDFIRLGRKINVVDRRLHDYHERNIVDRTLHTKQSLEEMYNKPRLVASTCLGINHALFRRRTTFDAVVIDEASQILQPTCIGPLRFAKGPFILVGDHYQLPPLVKTIKRTVADSGSSRTALEEAGSESLFRRLCNFHPEAVVSLRRQYRMQRELMDLSNHAVYSGNLLSGLGDTNTKQAALRPQRRSKSNNLSTLLEMNRHAFFLDTSECNSPELVTGRKRGVLRRKNTVECALIVDVVRMFLEDGVRCDDITVLTPYKAQLNQICQQFEHRKLNIASYTIDQYQGKDNHIVIASLVDSEIGADGLLWNWRRLNVLLTRAKEKLILVGNSRIFEGGGHVLQSVIHYMESREMIIAIPSIPLDTTGVETPAR